MSSPPVDSVPGESAAKPPGYVGKLPLSLKAGWGVGGFGSLGMLWLVNVFLMFFLVNHLGMNAALAGIILFITRIYDVISDPLIGHLSDNTRSRWGKRRPWMFIGAFVSGICAILAFNVPNFDTENTTAIYELVVLLMYFTGFTLFYVPFMAMPAEMTDDYNERTSIMSYRVGYSFAAGIIIAAGMPALIATLGGDRAAYEVAAMIAGALITVSMLMSVVFTSRARELEQVREKRYTVKEYFTSILRNRPFLSLAALKFMVFLGAAVNGSSSLFFMTYVMERAEMGQAFYSLMSNVAGMCALPLWARWSRGRDKVKVYLLAVAGTTLVVMSWALAGPAESNFVFGLRSFLGGAFGAGGLIMGFSMLPDTIEYDRLKTGLDRAGLYAGLLGFIEKNAAAVAPMIVGFYFAAMGIVESSDGTVEQPDSAIIAIIAAKAWIPAGLNLVAAAILLTYRLTEEKLATMRLQAAAEEGL